MDKKNNSNKTFMNLITVHFVRKGNSEVGTISVLLMSKGYLAKKTRIILEVPIKDFPKELYISTIKTDYRNQIEAISHSFNHKKSEQNLISNLKLGNRKFLL